jgi:hypothetical protein
VRGEANVYLLLWVPGEGTPVLGDSWLKNVLVVFDVGNGTDLGLGGQDRKGDGGGSVRVVGKERY